MPCTVLLIRHGQSLHNADGNSFSGVTDVRMDEIGYAQCRRLTAFFDRCPVDSVLASPLHRARESARLIFPSHCEKLDIANWLKEFNYGNYEGKRPDELGDDPVILQWNATPADLVFPGGDSVREHAEQTYSAFLAFAGSLSPESRVACVTHKTTIRLLVALIMGLDLNRFRDVPCSNCAVTDIRFDSNKAPYLHALNVSPEYTDQGKTGDQ